MSTKQGYTYNPYVESEKVKELAEQKAAAESAVSGFQAADFSKQQDYTDLYNKLYNRDPFSYDFNADALYQQYKDKYIQQGKMAMADTMGQAVAMTGGYGNSYAATVGNQAYQNSLANLNDIIPELYQMAYNKYNQEGQDMRNMLSILSNERTFEYGKEMDRYNRLNNDRTYTAGRYDSEKAYDYQSHRDAIADDQWAKEYALKSDDATNDKGKNKDDDVEEDSADVYADWDAGDWESYFAQIRQSEGKSAAEKELNYFIDKGLIPKNCMSYAAIGARGTLGH